MENTPKEWRLLKQIKTQVQRRNSHTVVPLGDDAFVYRNFAGYTVVCQDMMVEDVHFSRDYFTASDLGFKSLAVNLSDIAAMGAHAHFAQVSLALPKNLNESWLDQFYVGMLELADRHNVEIIGGDLCASTDKITVDVSIQGSTENPIQRKKAQAGDLILCSGPLGVSTVGRLALKEKISLFDHSKQKHLRPSPRLDLVNSIQQHHTSITSLMDCSDGLINDCLQLLPDGYGAEIHVDDLHVHEDVQKFAKHVGRNPFDFVFWGGEDYELLMTVKPQDRLLFPEWNIVGIVTDQNKIKTIQSGKTLEITEFKGWSHFS